VSVIVAAEREEDLVEIARQELGELHAEPRSDLGRHERADVRHDPSLLRDRVDDPRVGVPDVHAHELAVEVEVPLAVDGEELAAAGGCDGDRPRRTLLLPVVQRVPQAQVDDLVGGKLAHRIPLDSGERQSSPDEYHPPIAHAAEGSHGADRSLHRR
jgi:hypothetical protein